MKENYYLTKPIEELESSYCFFKRLETIKRKKGSLGY